jgi:hypothetical protein
MHIESYCQFQNPTKNVCRIVSSPCFTNKGLLKAFEKELRKAKPFAFVPLHSKGNWTCEKRNGVHICHNIDGQARSAIDLLILSKDLFTVVPRKRRSIYNYNL